MSDLNTSGSLNDNTAAVFLIHFIILLLFWPPMLLADDKGGNELSDKYDNDKALEFSQSAIGKTIGNYQFFNQDKKKIDITQYQGKPLVVSLIYTSCHHVCPTLTNHLNNVVEIAREALGQDSFSVVTIGFDTEADSPERMRLFARERNIDFNGWDFLSTDKETIESFGKDIGFIFFKSPKGFDHLSQTTLLDAKGRVYRQVYGVKFEAPHLIEPLKEMVYGKEASTGLVDSWINNIRLFCTLYDPRTGRYEFDYSIFIRIGLSILVLGAIATFIIRSWRQNDLNRLK